MKIYYVLRPYQQVSGFNVLSNSKEEAIALSNITLGYCENTIAREIDNTEAGILISKETNIPYEQNPMPNFKMN